MMSESTANALQELRALADLVVQSVDGIEKFCAATGGRLPSASEPFSLSSEAILLSPEVANMGKVLAGAAFQLISIVQPSYKTVMTAALQVCSLFFAAASLL